ncbi:hypothetical protein [Neolewinella agarilytica]|uniref:hypothetical protein n=1 Tax=Neolewinella agarilytica TaxID=478744 RepID=UPI002355C317|nr:hypothetical protein [Neolewinella agarilytica]
MSLRLLLPVSLTFLATSLLAQFTSIEIYGGIGTFDASKSTSISTYEALFPISGQFGEDFFLRQLTSVTDFSETTIAERVSGRLGVEVHFPIGGSGSIYSGLGIQSLNFSYNEISIQTATTEIGPVDTVFIESPDPGTIGDPISACDGNGFQGFSNEPPRGFLIDVGVPVGYRQELFNGNLSLRAQVSINVPILVSLRREAPQFEVLPEGCFQLTNRSINLRDAHQVSSILFRAGGGFDVHIGHSFSIGVLVEKQLNDYFTSTQGFVFNENTSAQVPAITTFRPLTAQLVGRYRLR